MNLYKYNRMKNETTFICWVIINIVLTIAYIIELIKGNRTLYYLMQYLLVTWMPLIINYAISLIIGRGNLNIRYSIAIGYIVFYAFTMATTNSLAAFCYIMPMAYALMIYDDVKLMDYTFASAVIINIVSIAYRFYAGIPEKGDITFFEIQIACVILCTIFTHRASIVLVYGNNKLNKLNEEINKDELTGVYNRHFLKKLIQDKFKETNSGEVVLAVFDIDDFKRINDNYGHKFGDLVLRKLAGILQYNIDIVEETYVLRLGGDEFAIISSLATKEVMEEICNNACNDVTKTKLRYGDEEVNFTISVGVASNKDKNCDSYNKLYDAADQMLYTVKTNGKNSVAVTKE